MNSQVHDHDSLGSEHVWENLEGVSNEKTGPTDGIEDTEEPDPCDLNVTAALDIGLSGGLETCGSDSPGEEHSAHTTEGDQEEGSATDSVDETGGGKSDDQRQESLTTVKWDSLVLGHDTHGLVEQTGVVGDNGVTGVLRDDTHCDKEQETVSVTTGAHEVKVGALLGGVFETEGLLDFLPFELDGDVVTVTVGVVLGENGESFLISLLGDQPTWRFWDPVDEGDLDERWDTLAESERSP